MALLAAECLSRRYGRTEALKEASFVIGDRRCIALLGPNGAGKTTTLSILAGLLKPTSGKLEADGRLAADRRQWMGFLPQQPAFFGWMTGFETMVSAGQLCGLSTHEAKERAETLLKTVGLRESAHRRVSGYSGGMKQRLGLAQAVVHRPRLLLLDEPVSALDPIGRRDVLDMLAAWKKEMTVLLSTHVLHDAEQVCDELILMNKGRVVMQGDMDALRETTGRPFLKIVVEDDGPSIRWLKSLKGLPGTTIAESGTFHCHLMAEDMNALRKTVLRGALEEGVKLQAFEMARKSLEQWFIEAVRA
ncbi:ABC transporter ATP-binding protein [Cohnella boryungensis]|uniref:ATP-binding cassette domain-containing protein n=1 Tax=Cohnella boryungensis TaxID=768479 RepID=A0ABV8S9J4_9BACL